MAFPTTRWSLLAQATMHGGPAQQEALAEFYRRYRAPVVVFIARRTADRSQAEDLAQEFFLHLMESSALQRADHQRGRFRSFLLGALLRFLARDHTRKAAAKRGGGAVSVSLDALTPGVDEPAIPADVAQAFDGVWARELLARVRADIEGTWRVTRPAGELKVLVNFLPGAAHTPTYDEAAAALGWTVARLKTEVFRLRKQFRDGVRAEVMLTVDAPHEVEAELIHLHHVLAAMSS